MPTSSIVFIQLFWLSFAVVGAGIWLAWAFFLRKIHKPSRFLPFLRSTHPFLLFLVSFATGFTAMAPIIIPAFLLEWSLQTVLVLYIVLLGLSLVSIIGTCKKWWPWLLQRMRMIRKRTWLMAIPIVLILVGDFVLSLWVGGTISPDSDAYVHMAKINLLLDGRFTLDDPFFGYNGVIESRYHVNILLAMYALGAKVTAVSALHIWELSSAFWRLMMWISLFSVAWTFLPKMVRWRWSYLVLAALPFFYSYKMYFAVYPNKTVAIWFALVIVGLLRLFQKKDCTLLIIGSVLVSLTHPSYAIIALGLVGLVGIIMLATRSFKTSHIVPTLAVLCILAAPVVYTLSFPNNMSDKTFADTQVMLTKAGDFTYLNIRTSPQNWMDWTLLLSSLAAYVYFIVRSRGWVQRGLTIGLVVYFALIAYNPPLLEMTKETVPLWLLARFQEINRLAVIAPMVGFLVVITCLTFRLKKHRWLIPTLEIIVVGWLCFISVPQIQRYINQRPDLYEQANQKLERITEVKDTLHHQVVLSELDTSYDIATLAPSNVVDITENHASPMTDIDTRRKCGEQLRAFLEGKDLRAAGVTRVLASTPDRGSFAGLAGGMPYLREIKRTKHFIVYEVLPRELPYGMSVCYTEYGK